MEQEGASELTRVSQGDPKELLIHWLKVLYFARIGNLAVMVLSPFQLPFRITSWVSFGITAASIAALYMLGRLQKGYAKASVMYGISLAGNMLAQITGTSLITTVTGFCGIIASYQEYHAHAELVKDFMPELMGKWTSLFYWEIVVGIVGGFVSMAGVMLGVAAGMKEKLVVGLIVALVMLMEIPLRLMYLRYMSRMRSFFAKAS